MANAIIARGQDFFALDRHKVFSDDARQEQPGVAAQLLGSVAFIDSRITGGSNERWLDHVPGGGAELPVDFDAVPAARALGPTVRLFG